MIHLKLVYYTILLVNNDIINLNYIHRCLEVKQADLMISKLQVSSELLIKHSSKASRNY